MDKVVDYSVNYNALTKAQILSIRDLYRDNISKKRTEYEQAVDLYQQVLDALEDKNDEGL